jgi:predicted neuraminidase
LPQNIIEPVNLKDEYRGLWEKLREGGLCNQEPGVVELSDGSLMMWCRTNGGYMYKSFSEDDGSSWSEYRADKNIISPCGPQSVKVVPGSSSLLCVYNDHSSFNFAEDPWWNWRTPLSFAVSDDNGASWNVLGELEGLSHNYCYASILFFDDHALFTYYISQNTTDEKGERRFNLAALKAKIIRQEVFL